MTMGQHANLWNCSSFVYFFVSLLCFSKLSAKYFSRFHYGQPHSDYVFEGKRIAVQYTRDILSCGHLCLAYPRCGSYNYEVSALQRGLCEINEAGPRDTLKHKPGFVFIDLLSSWPIPPRSCWGYKKRGAQSSGLYHVQSITGDWYQAICDLTSEPDWAWTLVISQNLANKELPAFRTIPLFNDSSVNEDTPNWEEYRLSKKRIMQLQLELTHWRVTCSFPVYGVDYRDYVRANFSVFDPLTLVSEPNKSACKPVEFINIRGHGCSDCTTGWWQKSSQFLHIDSYFKSCEYGSSPGGVPSEDNFGHYNHINPVFRCTERNTSSTNHWFGRRL